MLAWLLVLPFCIPAAHAQDSVGGAVRRLLKSQAPGEKAAAVREIAAANPSPASVADLLTAGLAYEGSVSSGWSVREYRCLDGVSRPWHLYMPATYSAARKCPVFFFLHGGVSRPEVIPPDDFAGMRGTFEDVMERGEFIHVLPETSHGAEWWTDSGAGYLLGIIEALKAEFNVDENRIFVSGFSDGGSGAFYLALFHNTPFAGFIPLNGHIAVADMAGGKQVYLPNLSNKPLRVVNTDLDQLYPAAQVTPFVEKMKEAGARVDYKIYENVRHEFSYAREEIPVMVNFMKNNPRVPHPRRVCIESAAAGPAARCHWARIEELGDPAGGFPFPDFNVVMTQTRVMLGVTIDQQYQGEGVKIMQVMEESPAEKMGMKAGDLIIEADGTEVNDFTGLRSVLGPKKFGDKIRVKVMRGSEAIEMSGEFRQPKPRAAFSRARPAGRLDASAEGNKVDVRTRGVRRYTLFLSRELFDLGSDIEILTNGERSFRDKVRPSLKAMLEAAAEDKDRSMVYWAKIEIEVPPENAESGDF